jgi:uncharacterized protein YcbK (DUF882 family)
MLSSPFFSIGEFGCHDGTPYPVDWIDSRLQWLCDVLDLLRAEWDGPLVVVSGYRTYTYNLRIGGASRSQHVQGRAADVRPLHLRDVPELHALALKLFESGKLPALGGLGRYAHWIHVDVRERPADGHLAQWLGTGIGSEPA